MTVRPKTDSRPSVEFLEARRLLAIISVTDFGATPNNGTEDGPAIQRAINASAPGDTVLFPTGTYNVGGTLTFRGDRVFQGVEGTVLKFNLNNREYGATIYKDSSNITIQGLKFDGGGISLSHGRLYTNIKIINNEITRTAGTAGVYASIASEGLIVEGNKFNNFNHWGGILWHMNNGSFSKNLMCGIQQGAHILAPRDNNVVSFNVGRHLTRMGIEMQAHAGSIARNTTVEGNVFYDWRLPYRDSFGLSIVPDNSINTRIINNYLSANHTGDWNPQAYTDGQGLRYGYGIEAGFASGEVSGNVIGGPFANMIVVSHPNTPVNNNRFFGIPKWGAYIATEGGPNGSGSWHGSGNTQDPNFGNMPGLPAGTPDPCTGLPGGGGGPTVPPRPNPTPPPSSGINAPSNLVARAANANRVDLSWKDNSNNEIGFKIERSLTGPDGPWTQVGVVTTGLVRWSNYGLPANTTIWYRARAYGAAGNSLYSNVAVVKTPALGGGGGGGVFNPIPQSSGGSTNNTTTSPFSDLLV